MPRFSPAKLRSEALQALESIYQRCKDEPIEGTPELGFLLAFLANEMPERWPVDQFWREARTPPIKDTEACRFGRHQTLTAAMNGIYLQLGLKRG